jgi:hypothetical protein
LPAHIPAALPDVYHPEISAPVVPEVLVEIEPEENELIDDRSIEEINHANDTDDQDYNFNFFTI